MKRDLVHIEKISPDIVVEWRILKADDEGWSSSRCLYAYITTNKKEILYIGKAWGVTVKGRWNRASKENFWNDLERKRGIFEHLVLLGNVTLSYSGRLTSELLVDIETLLIMGEQPWGNIQSKQSRIPRPGLVVECAGVWPGQARFYADNA
jgi:hypothetical protein